MKKAALFICVLLIIGMTACTQQNEIPEELPITSTTEAILSGSQLLSSDPLNGEIVAFFKSGAAGYPNRKNELSDMQRLAIRNDTIDFNLVAESNDTNATLKSVSGAKMANGFMSYYVFEVEASEEIFEGIDNKDLTFESMDIDIHWEDQSQQKKDMSLNQSQLYYLKKVIGRKTKVIVAAINREFGQGRASITNRIVKSRINKELHLKYGISRISDLPVEEYESVLGLIKNYRFFYNGKHFG